MNATEFLERIAQISEIPRPYPFDLLRQEIDREASNPPSPKDMEARVTWFHYGLTAFGSQFIDHYCQQKKSGQVVPNVPINGSGQLPMDMDSLALYLTPEYLGLEACMKMFVDLESMYVRLLQAFQDTQYLEDAWGIRLQTLREKRETWLADSTPTQPTEPDRPVAA